MSKIDPRRPVSSSAIFDPLRPIFGQNSHFQAGVPAGSDSAHRELSFDTKLLGIEETFVNNWAVR